MTEIIREARPEDYEPIVRLLNQVQELHEQWRPDIYKFNRSFFTQSIFEEEMQNNAIYVAQTEAGVKGVMEITYRHIESPVHVTRDVIFVDSMAVDREYRGKGIGHLFFDKLKEMKEAKKLDGIELQVNARNNMAYEMYKKYGFTEKSINMELL